MNLAKLQDTKSQKLGNQKSLAFLYTNNEKSEKEIKESIPFTISTKGIKYLAINLPIKEIKELYTEPVILECEVKWALESITMNKASGGDGIPVELFQNLNDDAVNVLHSVCQQIWKTQQWPQDLKRTIFIPIPKKGNAKECQTTAQLYSSHMLVK